MPVSFGFVKNQILAKIQEQQQQSSSSSLTDNNVLLDLDAGNASSYSGSGSTWYDLSGNGYDLEIIGATYDSNSPESFNFNGSGNYGRTSEFTSNSDGNFSFNLWVNPDTVAGSRGLMTKFGHFEFFLYNGTYFSRLPSSTTTLSSGNLVWQQSIGSTLSANTWQLISFTYDGTTRKIYVNGSLIASNTTVRSSFTPSDGRLLIGAAWESNPGYAGGYGYDGKMSQMQLHHTALTDDEILAHYNQTKGTYGY